MRKEVKNSQSKCEKPLTTTYHTASSNNKQSQSNGEDQKGFTVDEFSIFGEVK